MSVAIQPFGQGVVSQNLTAKQRTRRERRRDRRDEKQDRRQDRRDRRN